MGKYYVGINGTNVICNGEYFDGYISAYPIGEKGNISYFDVSNPSEKLDEAQFHIWVKEQIKNILDDDPNARFTYFNKKMADVCSFLPKENLEGHNDWDLLDFLNDKYRIRRHLSHRIKMLDYLNLKGKNVDYKLLVERLEGNEFVIQGRTGSGGLTTHFIRNDCDLEKLKLEDETIYSMSAYQENLPINTTLLVAKSNVVQLPTSVQLIKNTGNFIYTGGDFVMPKRFNTKVTEQIELYNNVIGKELQKLGYRGICGVDYIICPNGSVKFMELNPRYQGSSFLLSMAMKNIGTSIARLNAECFSSESVSGPNIDVDRSFVNCKKESDYLNLGAPDEVIKKVEHSTFRKIYNRSICLEDTFERPNDLTSICCM